MEQHNVSTAELSAEALKKKRRKHTIVRTAIRVVFFIAMPGAFAAGFTGIKLIFQNVASGSPIEMNAFTWTLILLTAFTIVFGRFFCGYACAFGSFGDFVNWVSSIVQTKLFKRKKPVAIPQTASRLFRNLKYLNLAFIVLFISFSIYSSLKGTSPWDVFSQFTSLSFNFGSINTVGIVLFAAVVVLMAFEPRGFCMYLCPLGAFFALLPTFGGLRRDKERCIKGCGLCAHCCPADITIEHGGASNGECLGCDKCAAACPRANLAHYEIKLVKSELAAIIIKAVLFFVLGSLVGLCRFL